MKTKINNDICSYTDDALIKEREELMDFIEKGKDEYFIKQFHYLLEIEREMTLREEV